MAQVSRTFFKVNVRNVVWWYVHGHTGITTVLHAVQRLSHAWPFDLPVLPDTTRAVGAKCTAYTAPHPIHQSLIYCSLQVLVVVLKYLLNRCEERPLSEQVLLRGQRALAFAERLAEILCLPA